MKFMQLIFVYYYTCITDIIAFFNSAILKREAKRNPNINNSFIDLERY